MTEPTGTGPGELRDRRNDPWRRQLEELLVGPYAGHGGIKELAIDLGISRRTLEHYLCDTATRRDPTRTNRLRIKQLWDDNKMGQ